MGHKLRFATDVGTPVPTGGHLVSGKDSYARSLDFALPARNPGVLKTTNFTEFRRTIELLGFDTSRNRRHSILVIRAAPNDLGGYHFTPSWSTYDASLIRYGQEREGKRKDGTYYTYWQTDHYVNERSLARHAGRIFSRNRVRHRQFVGAPDHIAINAWILNENVIALSRSPYSRVAVFDIDNHDRTGNGSAAVVETLRLMIEDFGVLPVFCEFSDVNGGCHVAFVFDRQVQDDYLSSYVARNRSRHPAPVEVLVGNKVLRLPCSATYTAGTVGIEEGRPVFSPFDKETQVNDLNRSVRSRFFDPGFVAEYSRLTQAGESARPSRTPRKRMAHQTGMEVLRNDERYKLRAYHRHGRMIHLAFAALNYGLEFEDYFELCQDNNIDSRDIARWSLAEFRTHARSAWEWAVTHYRDRPMIRETERYRLPDRIVRKLGHPLFTTRIARALGGRRVMTTERHVAEAEKTLVMALERLVFMHQNPRHTRTDVSEALSRRLAEGAIYTEAFHADVRAAGIATNARRMVTATLTASGLFRQIKHSTLGYRWGRAGFARQFFLSETSTDIPAGNVEDALRHVIDRELRVLSMVMYRDVLLPIAKENSRVIRLIETDTTSELVACARGSPP